MGFRCTQPPMYQCHVESSGVVITASHAPFLSDPFGHLGCALFISSKVQARFTSKALCRLALLYSRKMCTPTVLQYTRRRAKGAYFERPRAYCTVVVDLTWVLIGDTGTALLYPCRSVWLAISTTELVIT